LAVVAQADQDSALVVADLVARPSWKYQSPDHHWLSRLALADLATAPAAPHSSHRLARVTRKSVAVAAQALAVPGDLAAAAQQALLVGHLR
jgi:hypothetical protein